MKKNIIYAAITLLLCLMTSTIFAQETSYDALMKAGNSFFAKGSFYEAKSYYEKALKQKNNDTEARKKLNLTLKKIEEEGQKQEVFYEHLDRADELFGKQKYNEALTHYQNAIKILPNDEYAQKQIIETKRIIQLRQEKQDAYDNAILQGTRLMESEDYEAAIVQFKEASSLFPDDNLPKEKITEATNLSKLLDQKTELFDRLNTEAEQLEKRKNYNAAIEKLNEAYELFPNNDIKEKIGQLTANNEKNQRFNNAVTEADILYGDKAYNEARAKYTFALSIEPDDAYTKDMISRIDGIFNSPEYLADKHYNEAIARGSDLLAKNQYENALNAYQNALDYKPNDEFATNKINEINDKINADKLKASNEALFADLVQQGDNAKNNGDLDKALNAYNQAITIKDDANVSNKIAEINNLIAQNNERNRQYTEYITQGDKFMSQQKYEEAISSFRDALSLKPQENYPNEQITAAEGVIAAQKASAAERKALIDKTLAEAKNLFNNADYNNAKDKYQQVVAIDKGNTEANDMIKQIDIIIAKAEQEREQNYSNAMHIGEELMNEQHYADAATQFEKALLLKPNDTRAQTQLDEANRLEQDRITALRVQYNAFIKDADRAFAAKEYDKANENYKKADKVGLNETYPAEMLAKITRIIEENKIYELNTEPIAMATGAKQRFDFKPVDVASRRSNYILLKLRNPHPEKSFQMIMSFGDENGKNGGLVLPIADTDETQDYIIRIGSLYKWFSENNTWLEFISENDEVEITLVEISKS